MIFTKIKFKNFGQSLAYSFITYALSPCIISNDFKGFYTNIKKRNYVIYPGYIKVTLNKTNSTNKNI